jgi:hypothetical protein
MRPSSDLRCQVVQQDNFCDCGLFVLQSFEKFFMGDPGSVQRFEHRKDAPRPGPDWTLWHTFNVRKEKKSRIYQDDDDLNKRREDMRADIETLSVEWRQWKEQQQREEQEKKAEKKRLKEAKLAAQASATEGSTSTTPVPSAIQEQPAKAEAPVKQRAGHSKQDSTASVVEIQVIPSSSASASFKTQQPLQQTSLHPDQGVAVKKRELTVEQVESSQPQGQSKSPLVPYSSSLSSDDELVEDASAQGNQSVLQPSSSPDLEVPDEEDEPEWFGINPPMSPSPDDYQFVDHGGMEVDQGQAEDGATREGAEMVDSTAMQQYNTLAPSPTPLSADLPLSSSKKGERPWTAPVKVLTDDDFAAHLHQSPQAPSNPKALASPSRQIDLSPKPASTRKAAYSEAETFMNRLIGSQKSSPPPPQFLRKASSDVSDSDDSVEEVNDYSHISKKRKSNPSKQSPQPRQPSSVSQKRPKMATPDQRVAGAIIDDAHPTQHLRF